MDWVHTWSGLILGVIMFVIFVMGTLSVFKDETDQWFWPYARHIGATPDISLDRLYDAAIGVSGDHPHFLVLNAPTDRAPVPGITVVTDDGPAWRYFVDPVTYEIRSPLDSAAASHFFYPMHYRLHVPGGIWIVGAVSMFLLLALFSGVIIHRKIFRDFFTFRRGKKMPRLTLDLHNLTSVLALPFHIAITVSGILIFGSLYLQPAIKSLYPGVENARAQVFEDVYGFVSPEESGVTHMRVSSLDAMRTRAEPYFDEQPFKDAFLSHPHDKTGYVRLRSIGKTQVSDYRPSVVFDAGTGKVIGEPQVTPGASVQSFITGMHEIHFDHIILRWLYFVGGVAGSVMIATGFIYWIESRRLAHARGARNGVRFVEGLAVFGIMGFLTATAAYFVINQILPRGRWEYLGIERIYWEVIVFYAVWLLAIPHGAFRKTRAWRDQALLLAFLCVLAVLLNWIVTGDHLARTIFTGQWAIAIIDVMLLGSAALSVYAARRMKMNRQETAEKRLVGRPA